jgi:hypothetical protein
MGILSKWSRIEIGFAQVESKDGMPDISGGSGSIEASALEEIYMKTQRIEDKIVDLSMTRSGVANQSENKIAELDTVINYLPRDMAQGKGMSAIQIAKTFTITQVSIAAKNLEAQAANGSKYARLNQTQAESLMIALLVVNRDKDFIKPSVAGSFAAGQAEFINACKQYRLSHDNSDEGCIYIDTMNRLLAAKKIDSRIFKASSEVSSDGGYVELYSAFKTPNVHKVDENGYTRAYEVKITANPAKDYPYRVELTTMLGKPRVDKNGDVQNIGIDTSAGSIKDQKRFNMDLTSKEWTNAVRMMIMMRDQMVDMGFREAYNLAGKLEYKAVAAVRA